ncbi:hypothetical protein [Kitasatospora purpeofusca]|uniref:hypothetical protein n=1 Tax=Kitasatospora purpeofusca TaxID=67352 RepID=UPI0036D2883C
MAAGDGEGGAVAFALLAVVVVGVGGRGVFERGSAVVFGFPQPVVVAGQDGLALGGGFVERGLAGEGLLAHLAA